MTTNDSSSSSHEILSGIRYCDQDNHNYNKKGGWESANWSGYAIETTKKDQIISIAGDWIVPSVKPSKENTYSTVWIGIDGFNNHSLIQVGTIQDFSNGNAHYTAFWEVLPSIAQIIPYPVAPNDQMHAKISQTQDHSWTITLRNITQNWKYTKETSYSGPRTSAEWIIEAPTVNGQVASFSNYGKTIFSDLRVNSMNPRLILSDRGIMIQNGKQVSTPSYPNCDGDAISMAYGPVRPSPPATE